METNRTLTARNLGARSGQVEFIVLHDTAGSGTPSDAEYLAHDPEHRKISVDFCVTKDGTIYQLNPDLAHRCTFHAGRHTHFRTRTNGAVNQHSIGIEISQKADMRGLVTAYPLEQVTAVASVCQSLCSQFHLGPEDITTHAKIITDGSRTDPRNFPWTQFWAIFNNKPTDDPAPTGPAVPDLHATAGVENRTDPQFPVTHIVTTGDTLWGLSNLYHTTIEQIKARNGMNTPSNVIGLGQKLIVG